MIIERLYTATEKQILAGLILNTNFGRRTMPIIDLEYFKSDAARQVASWVIDYYKKYEQAPAENLQSIYIEKQQALPDDISQWIGTFLDLLATDFPQRMNESYLFDRAAEYFRSRRIDIATTTAAKLNQQGRYEDAEEILRQASRPLLDSTTIDVGINPFSLKTIHEMWTREKARTKMLTLIPGLDEILGGPLKSEWLIVPMGPMKRGKTWLCMLLAKNGLFQGLNVTVVSLESNYVELTKRLWQMLSKLHFMENPKDELLIQVPSFKKNTANDIVEFNTMYAQKYEKDPVIKVVDTIKRQTPGGMRLKMFSGGNGTIENIRGYLDYLETVEYFTTDVLIIDYLGLIHVPGNMQPRDKYDARGYGLKALAQEKQLVCICPHQGNRETLMKQNIDVDDVPEDIRILAHLDVMLGLNQNVREREDGIMRISVLAHRHNKTSIRQAMILQQLEIAQFALDDRVINRPNKDQFDDGTGQREPQRQRATPPRIPKPQRRVV
jgi:replicative DNA helicase